MQSDPTLFSQITSHLYASEFSRLVEKFPNAKPPRGLTEYDHFLAMCFGQLTYRESLRDIVGCLSSKPKLLYHLGFGGRVMPGHAARLTGWKLKYAALNQKFPPRVKCAACSFRTRNGDA